MFRTASKSPMIRHIALTVGAGAVVAGLSMAALLRLNGGMPWPVVVLASVLLASLCTAGVMIHLVRRYMPGIQAVRQGLERLDDGTWERLPDCGADDWRVMISALNRAAGRIRDQIRSLRTLGEIDRVLLGAADLEQALDAILGRVRRVTACRTAGIVLRDPDAPSHGRVFLAADAQHGLPLSRVSLDECMMATLAAEPQGLTVTRCEEVRHSFLRPLRNHGAEFFWLWPVMLDNQLRAVFTIGYREPPSAGPQIARAGSELVSRLAAVLARVSREEHLYRQAHYDPLTGLPNRLLFASTLSPEIAGAVPGLVRGAVLYVDLDHFKRVNDTAGHAAGDQLLRIAAQRLRSCVKETDTVARLGGDEFAVILRDVASRRDASAVGERIVVSLQQPVRAGGRDHQISASIGLALFPEDGRAIDEVLQNADKAMYRAKEEGRGCVLSYDSGMGSPQVETTGSGLQEALHQREFSLFYQPQYAARDGALTGLEALLRWQTQRQGMRGPDDFVPAAEESGLIVDIGGWVLETACAQLAEWRSRGLRPPTLSLNVSAQQLRHPEFVRSVRKALARFELPADQLELDIEEPVLASAANADIIHALAALGVRLALDGFSTGYASLSYLRQYPLSSVKLDRAFLTHVPGDAAAAQLVETVIVVAHKLGKRVVAEGIETVEQLDFLRERGCDSVQGFYLARPLQAAETSELLVSHARRSMPEVRVVTL